MQFRRPTIASILLLVLWSASSALAQSASPQPSQHRTASTPYSGDLSIFEAPGRDQKLHIEQVMDLLAIEPGKSVADIGAGSGWFTVRAARRVTSTGRIYAVDINPDAVSYVRERAGKDHLANVTAILSKPDNPELPPESVDAVLLLKTYHEVADPVVLMRNLKTSLRHGARIGIIERNGNGEDHGISKEIVLREAGQAGYRLLEEHDDLVKDDKMDYFLVLGVK
jgi:SAM-dependent methyltransferase